MKRIVIALGGNALQEAGKPATAESQLEVVEKTSEYIADIIESGYDVVLAHGNGPQVGRIVLQNEYASAVTPAMPFDVCGAMSQGYIGYHMQQGLEKVLRARKNGKRVVTVVTELDAVKCLMNGGFIAITVGGGGIPVIKDENGNYIGTAAVIDKDLASERLAEDIDADALVILTAVEQVCINFGKPEQKSLATMTVEEARRYMAEGHFAPGSMLPKVEAAVKFVESKPGRKAIITSLDKAVEALEGKAGTTVC